MLPYHNYSSALCSYCHHFLRNQFLQKIRASWCWEHTLTSKFCITVIGSFFRYDWMYGKDEAKKTKLCEFVLRSKFSLNCRNKPIYKTDESSDKLFLTTFCQLPDFLKKKHFWALWFSGTGFAWPWVCDRDPLWLTSNCYGAAHAASVVQVSTNQQQLLRDWLIAVSS